MSEKSDQLKKLIEAVVRKEVRAIVPQIVKEVMAGMIMESQLPSTDASAYGNSDKRRSLMEHTATAPRVEWDGDDMPLAGRGHAGNLILPDAAIPSSEYAQPIPIQPSQVPEAVIRAMNTDYRPLMEMLKKRGK